MKQINWFANYIYKNGTERQKRKSIKALPLYSFELVLDQDPNLALAGLRIELEKRLVQIATQGGWM